MTFSYTQDPLHNTVDAIRAEIGDTLDRDHLLENEEILYAYSKEGAVRTAAARCCEMLAARFASKESFRTATAQGAKTTVSAKYLEMARYLRATATTAGSTTGGGFVMPSTSQAQKDENRLDPDIPQPSFYRGMHKNPDVDDDSDYGDNSGLA